MNLKKITNKALCISVIAIFLISSTSALGISEAYKEDDIDPLVDLMITVNIKKIRALDKIDIFNDPDFYLKIYIDESEYVSEVWKNQKYIEPSWSIIQDVSDYEEFVNIKIQLWDQDRFADRLCDISSSKGKEVELVYSLKTGHWTGDDFVGSDDFSGYGRLNGCDDNTIYKRDRDCELWFDISQNDYDGDGIPYWTEVNVYETNPEVNDIGSDVDNDDVPIEWEYKWDYDPFEWNNHANLDQDDDGLDNFEEYLTSDFDTDPFRREILLELDQMEIGPNGEGNTIPDLTKDLLIDAYAKYNIVLSIDDSGEQIPFDSSTTRGELSNIYFRYFLNNNPNNWKRGVFHYGLIIYRSADHPGFVFSSEINGIKLLDCFQVSTRYHETLSDNAPFYKFLLYKSFNTEYKRAVIYAGAMMHETGHVLGIFRSNTPGCDGDTVFPWGKEWFKYRNYKSCMNYNYIYTLVDYSDGSHGKNDFNDWERIDLARFQREW